ncbi:3-hydroxyacyl-CoA dehydrogenase NAD-binding domain-containing protein [Labedaea rhizosphaerae]|uniref:3-hydroxyacyl-CoA dehydrogenase NAD-binding domain-containing protein n=1 Tax=Labedaea rhizosphaerae TaxID=598644 RepID=UPI001FB7A25D|nr:3-hydroxyacyl-CoA dehydrogenase NAD-binding domain-containing protein [Labedaea rhizosphaerae]
MRPIRVRGKADVAATALVYAYLNRAVSLLEAGYASAADIDTAMRLGCGLPAGPFAMLAELGPAAARDTLAKLHAETNDPAYRPAALLTEFVQSGLSNWLGDSGRANRNGSPRPVDRIGVLGTGTMACGIAEIMVTAGIPTVVVGREAGRAQAATARVAESLSRCVARGRLTQRDQDEALALLGSSGDRAALREVDLVIEAVVEDVPVKRAVFARLGRICKPGAVLATATSSLAVTELAAASGRPSDVIGMHFFNPAPAMRLVEIGSTPATAADVRATARELCGRLGKTGIECADRTGFIVNYLLFAYLNRAIALLDDGADVTELDDAVRAGFGYPLGPFALLDVIGLDVSLAILRRLHRTFPEPDFLAAPRLEQLVAAGRLGRKSGGGFHPPR